MSNCYGFLAGMGLGLVAGVGLAMANPKKSVCMKSQMEDTLRQFGTVVEEAAEAMMSELHPN